MKKFHYIFLFFILFFIFIFSSSHTTYAQTPSAPVLNVISERDGSLRISWNPPKSSGASSIIGYQIAYGIDGQTDTTLDVGLTTSHVLTGLTNNVTYTFFVRAENLSGLGPDSNSRNGTPKADETVPGPVLTPTLEAGNGTITVSWSQPEDSGGASISSYTIGYTHSRQAEQTIVVSSPARSYQFTNLSGGVSYSIRVRANNRIGSGEYSDVVNITSKTIPGIPTNLVITPGDTALGLSWNTSATNGDSPATYSIYYQDQETGEVKEIETESSTTSYTIPELINGREYGVKIRGKNSLGYSAYSEEQIVSPEINSEPVLVGIPSVISSRNSTTITWSTNKTMSSSIDYGLISTAVSTTEYNTDTRVTDHTVTLSDLLPCTSYTYKIYSRDSRNQTVTSTERTFTTEGCPVDAEVLSVERDSVVVTDGGVLDFTDTNVKVRFNIPSEVTCLSSVMTIQAKQLDKTMVQSNIEAPNKRSWLGNHVYNFTAYKNESEVIEQFDLPVDVSIEYTREDIEGINFNSLGIYHYNDDTRQWSTLNECSNVYNSQTGIGTITCETDSFSTFVLTSLPPEEIEKPSFFQQMKKLFSRAFAPKSFKKFSRCGIERPE